MTLVLTEADVRAVLDMPTAIEAVEESFRRQAAGESWLDPRRRLELPDRVLLNYMAAADREGGWFGMKVYSVARGVARFVVLLYRASTGELAALIEADFLGQMRTGAASGVATKYMARQGARIAGIFGTGLQAHTHLEAICRVRPIERARAFGRDPLRRADFCRQMTQRLGIPVSPATSAEEVTRESDILITATSSARPVLMGAWLAPGQHVNATGSNFAQKRELDDDAVNRAAIVAVDSIEQAQIEAGDLIQTFGNDLARWGRVRELAEIVSGKLPGRTGDDEITLFKSDGIATWDIAVGARVLERAIERGLGQNLKLGDKSGGG